MYKKLLLFFLLFSTQYINSQCTNDCVPRWGLATYVYDRVYNNSDPSSFPSFYYPVPYLDLYSSNSTIDEKIRVISYLDYNDGITVLSHLSSNGYFLPTGAVSRYEALAVIMEAWDIQPDYSGNVPFNDIDQSNPYFGYINEANDKNLLDGLFGSNFNGDFGITFNEMATIVSRVMNSNAHPVSYSTLFDTNNYFMPNNYTPENIGLARGLEQGVFSHYAKNSFVIPDIKLNLNFSHYYSTQMVELPESYFPIKPLGRGWTHTYNSYVIREDNVGQDEIDYYYIVWADGTIQIYNEDDDEYVSKGVYDDFDELNGDRLRIEKKDQTRYYFEQLDNDQKIYYLREIRDKNGNEINIEYETSDVDNDFERIKWVEAPSGKKLRFYYHNNTDFIDYIEDPMDRVIRFEYNEERLKKFYDAKNQQTKYFYVSNDEDIAEQHQYKRFLLRKIRLPENNTIEAEYDDDENGKLEHYTINDNETTDVDVTYNYGTDTPIEADVYVPMPNGSQQMYHYEFDEKGMLSELQNDNSDLNITYPTSSSNPNSLLPTNIDLNGLDVYYDYDDSGNMTSRRVESNEDEDFWYDDDNNLIRYRDENGNNTRFNYDNSSNLTSIEDALGNFIYLTYDGYGQMTSITNQEGITVNYTYEGDGVVSTITAPENLTSSFSYDEINRMITKTVNGLTSSYAYDANDNLTAQTNAIGLTTSFDYDANDNLVSIINANSVETSFAYNDKDQLISETFNSLTKQYEYNDDGTLDKYIKPSGIQINYDYTSEGKLDEAGTITDIDYYGNSGGKKEGLIEHIYSSNGHYEFDYDYLNRLDFVRDEYNNESINYEYDDVGNITEIDYPNEGVSFSIHYNYDAKNRMTRVRARINSSYTTIAEYEYRDDDLLKRVNYGNNIRSNISYDDAGRKDGINHSIMTSSNTGSVMYAENIVLDNRSNIVSENRLYSEEESSPAIQTSSSLYTYNGTNHLTSINGQQVYVNNDGNTQSWQTESNGAGIPDATVGYNYDIDDRLIGVGASSSINGYPVNYEYDVYGNRVRRINPNNNNTQYYTWDIINNNVILEQSNFAPDIYHVYGATGLEVSINAQTGQIINYYLGDIRGSVVATVGENNQNYLFNKYDDFGRLTYGQYGAITENFKYLGKYGITLEQLELGHYYIKARHYDASIGRFLTQDPIWSTNLYPYSENNPISRIDFDGKESYNFGYCSADSNSNKSLEFDGNSLNVYNSEGTQIYDVPATSGKGEHMNNPNSQHLENLGPIPEGSYTIKNNWNYQSLARQRYNIASGNGDWGFYNISIEPNFYTTRNSFYLHGGMYPGSAGCIDTGQNITKIYELFKSQKQISLHVRY